MSALFFAAIACGLLSSWLIGQQWIAAGLLVLWLLRVWRLKDGRCWIVTVSSLIVLAGWLTWQNQQFARISRETPRQQTLSLYVQPDAITLRGGQYQLVGQSSTGRVIVFGQLSSVAEKSRLGRIARPTTWRVTGDISPIAPPTNPGQFNAPAYYRSQRIFHQLTITTVHQVTPTLRSGVGWWLAQPHVWRQAFIRHCQQLPPTLQLYATSLLVGARPVNFRQTMSGIQQLGLVHLFSLSGMHVILLMAMLRWLLIHLHLSRQATDYWLLGLLPLYLILGGGADSLRRAVITAGLPIIWRLATHQQSGGLAGWSVALMLGIWHDPLVLCQLGGQLSYGLALLLMLAPSRSAWQLGGWIQLVSLPLLLVATAQWHVLTLIVNLLVAPLFSWVLLPVTMLGATTGHRIPVVTSSCEHVLATFQQLIEQVSHWPGLLIIGQPSDASAWLLGGITLYLLRRPSRRLALGLGITYLVVSLMIRYPLQGAVQFIDIGQGDSILIRQPFNRTVSLIDTGGRLRFPTPAWQNDGVPARPRVETVTVNYLHRLGITRIDTVYLSHKDVDHIGDLGALLRLMPVTTVVVPAGMAHLAKFKQLLRPALQAPRVVEALAGQRFRDGLTAVHPFHPGPAENGDSLVLTGVFGGQRLMFTGDLDRAGERAIVAQYPELRVPVLKLGHHGSKTASDPQVLRRLGVRTAILSVGRHNRYGHPNQETLQTLQQQGIQTYSTALQGMISYEFGPGRAGRWQTFLKEGNLYQRSANSKGPSRG